MRFPGNRMSLKMLPLGQIFSSLESRNYRLYFSGQSISLIGSWMQTIAMSWLVYQLTKSVFLLGLVGFTSQIPSFILSPFAGVITDRFNRRRIMILTQILFMVQALILCALVLTNIIQVWHIIVLSLIFGFISAFDAPARQSMVIDLIDKPENLGNAIALNSAMFNGARLVGPAIAGFMIALVGEGVCFLINAVSYIAVIVSLFKIEITYNYKNQGFENINKGLKEGLKYTFGFYPIRTLLIILSIISFVGMPYAALMPAYVDKMLKGDSHTLGFMMSVAGAGAFSAAIYLASRKTVVGLGKFISVNTFIFSIGLIGISLSTNFWLSLFFIFFIGFSMIASVASINTLIQTLTDEDKRGRVMSFYAMALMGVNPIGNLCTGSIASGIGLPSTLLFGGIILIIAGIWFESTRPTIRKYTHPVYRKKGIITEVAIGTQTTDTLHKS
jgi:MFS family permease